MARGRPKGSKNKSDIDKVLGAPVQSPEELKHEGEVVAAEIHLTENTPKFTKEQQAKLDRAKEVSRELTKKKGVNIKFASDIPPRERLPFKQKVLNDFTGGGIVRGTYTCLWGGKSVGKSTVVLDLIATTQKSGATCAYVNGERSYDPIWAQRRGVDTDKLIVVDVETMEQGLDVVIKLCREKAADLIIFDSLHGLAPKGELYEGKADKEKSVEQDTMALRARKLTQFFEMATAFVAESKCAVVLIGQSRMDLGSFVKIETLTGGHCFPVDTRILTVDGLKDYKEIQIGDLIPTINLKEKKIEYKPIKQKFIYEFKGKLNDFKNNYGIEFMFTDNHKCLVKKFAFDKRVNNSVLNLPFYKLVNANEERRTFAFPICFPSGKEDFLITDDEIKLIGWILTDGTIKIANKFKHNWERYANRVEIYQSKLKYVYQIENILKRLHISYTKSKRIRIDKRLAFKNTKPTYTFNILKGCDFVKKYQLNEDKSLPNWMFKLSDRQAKILFEVILNGDGHRREKNNLPAYIADGNKNNLEKLAHFFVTHNISVSFIKKDKRKNCYYLFLKQSDYLGFDKKHKNKITYNGLVWDIEVDNNLHFIERNGQLIATHNSLLHNCRLILKFRRGQGADAPVKTEVIEVDKYDDEGNVIGKKNKPIETKIGFSLVIHCDKSQVSGVVEGQEIIVPFYFESGIKEN